MKEKLYDPARFNEKAPAEGMAAVNTFSPEEEPDPQTLSAGEKEKPEPGTDHSSPEQKEPVRNS